MKSLRRTILALALPLAVAAPVRGGGPDDSARATGAAIRIAPPRLPAAWGVPAGARLTTRVRVLAAGKLLAEGAPGDGLLVPGPGDYTVEVNGLGRVATFVAGPDAPGDGTSPAAKGPDAPPRELRAKSGPLDLAVLWVDLPRDLAASDPVPYALAPVGTPDGAVNGLALPYGPSEVKERDRNALEASKLLVLLPGRYRLTVNGTVLDLELAPGGAARVRLAALALSRGRAKGGPADQVSGQALGPDGSLRKLEGSGGKPLATYEPRALGVAFAVAPGVYADGGLTVELAPGASGELARLEPKLEPLSGLELADAPGDGPRVTGFAAGALAAASGIRAGDSIVGLDRKPTPTRDAFAAALAAAKPGPLDVELRRPGREDTFWVTLVVGPAAPKTEAPKADAPRTEAPKTEAPKTDSPKTEAPKTDSPKTEAPKTDGGNK